MRLVICSRSHGKIISTSVELLKIHAISVTPVHFMSRGTARWDLIFSSYLGQMLYRQIPTFGQLPFKPASRGCERRRRKGEAPWLCPVCREAAEGRAHENFTGTHDVTDIFSKDNAIFLLKLRMKADFPCLGQKPVRWKGTAGTNQQSRTWFGTKFRIWYRKKTPNPNVSSH